MIQLQNIKQLLDIYTKYTLINNFAMKKFLHQYTYREFDFNKTQKNWVQDRSIKCS